LTVTLNWAHDLLVGSLANEAVVSDGLDVEETSIGLKADLPQRGKVLESFADPEVTGIVDGRFSAQGAVYLEVLLDTRALVVDVQGGNDTLGDDSGAGTAPRASLRASAQD